MTMLTSTEGASAILPEEYASLITEPLQRDALAFNSAVATVLNISTNTMQVPVLREDAGAEWVREGEEITPDDPTLDELTITPAKVAGLTIVSRELAEDSSPAAAELIGQGLARSIVDKVDAAFLQPLPAPAPAGLREAGATQMTTAGTDATERSKLAAYALRSAAAEVRGKGATPSALLMHPADAFALSTITESDSSRRPLLDNVDTFDGMTVLQSSHVPQGRAWIVDSSQVITVLREGTTLAVSDAPFFTSDRVAIRATLRVGFGVPTPARLAVVSLDGTAMATPAAA